MVYSIAMDSPHEQHAPTPVVHRSLSERKMNTPHEHPVAAKAPMHPCDGNPSGMPGNAGRRTWFDQPLTCRCHTPVSRLFPGAKCFAPKSSPQTARHMHPPNAFRIHTIQLLLARNDAIVHLEQVRSTCKNCGLRSSMTESAGLRAGPTGTTLTCPACGATGLMDEMEIWHHWLEQCRRQ